MRVWLQINYRMFDWYVSPFRYWISRLTSGQSGADFHRQESMLTLRSSLPRKRKITSPTSLGSKFRVPRYNGRQHEVPGYVCLATDPPTIFTVDVQCGLFSYPLTELSGFCPRELLKDCFCLMDYIVYLCFDLPSLGHSFSDVTLCHSPCVCFILS